MKSRAFAACVSLLIAGLIPGAAAASTFTVDQSQTNIADFIGGTDPIVAQTFTAGRYGPMDSIDVYLSGHPAHATLSLQGVTGSPAIPNGTVMGEVNIGLNDSGPGWTRFTFTNGPIVIPGHVYSFFLYLTGSTNSLWGSATDTYHRGRALMFYGGAWHYLPDLYTGSPADFAFKTNVGPAAPTPTPTHAPTAQPAHTATPSPASASIAAATETPVAAESAALPADSAVALGSAASSNAPDSSAAPAAPGAVNGGSGDFPMGLAIGGVVLLLLAGGGALLLLRRRGQPSA